MLETIHHWLPIIIAIYLPVSFIITYALAVKNDHVDPIFPYISDTGARAWESCVFGQLLNIGAVIGGIIIYTRYHQGVHNFEKRGRPGLVHLNTAAFVTGIISVLGVSLVGNFQSNNVETVHLVGAFMAFAIGFVYCFLQTIISFRSTSLEPPIPGNSIPIRIFRISLCVVDAMFLILLVVMLPLSRIKGPGPGKYKEFWSPDDPGYTEHLAATVSEWLVAFFTVIYFATFYVEFKQFNMKTQIKYTKAPGNNNRVRPNA